VTLCHSCSNNGANEEAKSLFKKVTPDKQTDPVKNTDDAADDPAIWIHPEDPLKSTIIGTNKQNGLDVYNLEGKRLYTYDYGRINNVDIRYDFILGDEKIDFAGGSNRFDNTVILVKINKETGELSDISARPITSQLTEVYGFCLYHDINNGIHYAIVNGKDGGVEQYRLFATEELKIDAELVRTFQVGSQTEGCVADDELGFLYIGEELKGIWKYYAHPDSGVIRTNIDNVSSEYLQADIEGLTIYYSKNGAGYLIASSQGNNSYAIYDRAGENNYIGSFLIIDGEIDDTFDTDGIDVSNLSFGTTFPNGFFIAQDGSNSEGDKLLNQNFKMVSWDKIARSFDPELIIDTGYRVKSSE
jgi:3-phytase